MSKSVSGYFSGTSGERESLIKAVREQGHKINPEAVIGITKDTTGRIIWLEKGHLGKRASGLIHIMHEHKRDFNSIGIQSFQIADFVLSVAAHGRIIGHQGKTKSRPIYEAVYNGKTYRVAITIGTNGYIVGANPR